MGLIVPAKESLFATGIGILGGFLESHNMPDEEVFSGQGIQNGEGARAGAVCLQSRFVHTNVRYLLERRTAVTFSFGAPVQH